jgi:hypothetical protein
MLTLLGGEAEATDWNLDSQDFVKMALSKYTECMFCDQSHNLEPCERKSANSRMRTAAYYL